MTTLAADNVNRVDQSGFGTASDGQTWARDAGVGVPNVVSNQLRVGPGGGDSHFLIGTGTAATVNCLCRVKSGDSLNAACVLFRYSSTAGTNVSGYRAGIFGSNLVVDRFVSGTRTNIGSTSIGYVIGEEWWVRAIASGTSITVTAWKDGNSEPSSPQLNLTDNGITSAGQYGLSVFMSNDFTYFDSLTITDNQSGTVVTQSITESNPTIESFTLTCAASPSEIITLAEAYALSIGASSTETVLNVEQWTIVSASTITESAQIGESVATILQVAPTETVTLSEALSLVLAISKSETNPITERIFAGPPPTVEPTHARITMVSPRGTITLIATRGTITMEAI